MIYQYVFGREAGPLGAVLDKKTHSRDYYFTRDTARIRLERSNCKVYTLTTPEGLKLKGFYYQAGEEPSDTIALIIHGYRSNHSETAGIFKELYHSRGIDILAVDNPAAGESEGELIGFGYTESRAAFLWLEMLGLEFGEDVKIILHGFSLGGGAVLLMSDEVPDTVKFIIDDCGFSGAPAILKPQLGLLYQPLNIMHLVKTDFKLSLGMTRVKPHLKHARVPILFVHGADDNWIDVENSEAMYKEAQKYAYSELWLVPGAEHCDSREVAGKDAYRDHIANFLEKAGIESPEVVETVLEDDQAA